jgi:hypothetical protein
MTGISQLTMMQCGKDINPGKVALPDEDCHPTLSFTESDTKAIYSIKPARE